MGNSGSDQFPIPPQVGPYRIQSRLGMGGMGAVYKAYDDRLKRTVAIKHVLPHIAADDTSRHRLRREAQAAASLSHPSIVQIYDIFEAHGFDWIVMEFVDGERLQSLIEAGRMGLAEAVPLCREIAEGLAEAHSKGIVHRDLKTENVMVTQAYHAKILDFGLAKNMISQSSPDSDEITDLGAIMGTGRAMSPEQAMGEEVDHRSDLFSLGTLIYETVTARSPFVGNSVYNTLAKVCSARHTPARQINPHVPEELSNLLDRLLEKNPEHRPQSAREVIVELRVIEKLPLPQWGGTFPLGTGRPNDREAAAGAVDFLDLDPARLPPPDRPPQASSLHDLARLAAVPPALSSVPGKPAIGEETPAFPLEEEAAAATPGKGLASSQELTAFMGRGRWDPPSKFEATAEIPPFSPQSLPADYDSATSVTLRPPSGIYLRVLLMLRLADSQGQRPSAKSCRDFERKLRYLSLEFEAQQAEDEEPSPAREEDGQIEGPLKGLLLFERPSLAARCARAFLAWSRALGDRDQPLFSAAMHMGELQVNNHRGRLTVSGQTLAVTRDLLAVTHPHQVLAGSTAYGLGRRARREVEDQDEHEYWSDHGGFYCRRLGESFSLHTLGLSQADSRRQPLESPDIRRL